MHTSAPPASLTSDRPQRMTDCIFCEIVAGRAGAQRVGEDKHTVSFMRPGIPEEIAAITVRVRQAEFRA